MKFDFPDLNWRESRDLLTRAVSPRPIALVSTVGEDGVYNLAPFAQYGLISIRPVIVFIGIATRLKAIAFSGDVYCRTTDTFKLKRHDAHGTD